MTDAKKLDLSWPEMRAHTQKGADFRADRRRSLLRGESLWCVVEGDDFTEKVRVVDLSLRGLAFEYHSEKRPSQWLVGQEVSLHFARKSASFVSKGRIAHSRYSDLTQICTCGVQFDVTEFGTVSSFTQSLGESYIPCSSFVRPQASCRDSFLFRETQLFQVNGFTHLGLDLVVSARLKSILPGQTLDLDVFIPGHKLFQKIRCVHSGLLYQSRRYDRYRIFCYFKDADKEFFAAIGAYLLMMNSNLNPKIIRKLGYNVSTLDHISTIEALKRDDYLKLSQIFESGAFGESTSDSSGLLDGKVPLTYFRFNIGAAPAACFSFSWYDKGDKASFIADRGFDVPLGIRSYSRLELNSFYRSSDVPLTDCLVPIFIQFVRIAYNENIDYLLLVADQKLRQVLETIGLKQVSHHRGNSDQAVFSLELEKVLTDEKALNDKKIWHRIYLDVKTFLQALKT